MKVIITGGTGLIGRALTASLLASNHDVVILSRNPSASAKSVQTGARVVGWDARTGKGWTQEAEGADAIVNLAGASIDQRWSSAYKEKIQASRVEAGKAVIDAIKSVSNKPKALIQASAVGYYGPRGDEILTESAAPGNDYLAEVCKAWEASTEDAEALGVRRAVIRTGIVFSTKGGALARLLPIFRMFAGGPVGGGKQYMPWIHIGDEADAIRFLMDNPKASGVFNLAAPTPVTNKEFSYALGRALGRPAFAPVPGIAVNVLYGEMSTIVLDGQRAIPQHLLDLGYQFRFTEVETALRHLIHSGVEEKVMA